MTVRFLHAADVHLGYRQYGSEDRYCDFRRALDLLIAAAINENARFLCIAGDLFHKRTIEPRTLWQAYSALSRLKDAGIPCIAIEGNHDRSYLRDSFSWLDYLAQSGLIVLLGSVYRDGQLVVEPWDPKTSRGAFYDVAPDMRVYGIKYVGASTERAIADLAAADVFNAQASRPYTILMLHAGLPDVLNGDATSVKPEHLDALRPFVDYVALGHIHKPFQRDDWIYNPGSLETTSISETAWPTRGYLRVDVSTKTGSDAYRHTATQVTTARRPFLQLHFDVRVSPDAETLYRDIEDYLRSHVAHCDGPSPVVSFRLVGPLPFARADLDLERIQGQVEALVRNVLVQIRDLTTIDEIAIQVDDSADRMQIERKVLEELFLTGSGMTALDSERWARLALQLKQLSLAGADAVDIISELERFDRDDTC